MIERDHLIHPDDMVLLDNDRLAVMPPRYLIKCVRMYSMIKRDYPDILPYLHKDEAIPLDML